MGPALPALALAWGLALAQERDPRWEELFRAWGDEFRAVKALRADPGRRAEADQLHGELVEQLAAWARELALPLHHETLQLGSDPARASDLDARLAWLGLSAAAARLCADEGGAARADQLRARELAAAGRRGEAVRVLESALLTTENETLRAYLLQELAEQERRLGSFARVLALLAELQGLVERVPALAFMQPKIDGMLSYVYIDLGLPDRATEAVHRLLERAGQPSEARKELVEARVIHANWLLAVGDHERLVELVSGYLAEDGARADPPAARAELLLFLGIAELALELEDPARAPRGAERVREALALRLAPEAEAFARLALAEQHLGARSLADAARELASARTLLEAWRGSDERLLGSAQGVELVTLEARLALERGDPPGALGAARERLVAAFEAMLAAWSLAPEREGGVGWLLYPQRRSILGEYTRLSLALEGPRRGAESALEKLLAVDTRGTLARRGGIEAPSLERIRAELLSGDRGLLIYLPARAESHVFALDRARLEHVALAPSGVLERARRSYLAHLVAGRSALSDPAQRAWALEVERRLAAELSGLLFPPPVRVLLESWNGVTLVGDTLGTVPFEWLPLGDEAHLGVRMPLDLLPSLPLGVSWARAARPESASDLVLVGGALSAAAIRERWPELEPLVLGDELVETIAAPYAPERVRVLRGPAATRRGLLELDLGSVAVLQFLGHGVLERERERPLALVLSAEGDDPGLFRCEDAERGPAPRLVVLSACQTGLGPARKGDPGTSDMSGAWLSSGAQAVLLTRADLAFEEAVRASSVLHRSLAEGRTPAEGLRAAREELVQRRGGEAPFLGGLLTVVGLGHRPVFERAAAEDPRAASPLLAVVGVALVLGFLLGFLARKARR